MSGALGRAGVVAPDIAAACWGRLAPTCYSVVLELEHILHAVSLRDAARKRDVHEGSLGVLPHHRALSLLYHRGFQQVLQFLVNYFPSSVVGLGANRMIMADATKFWLAQGKMGVSLLPCRISM